MSVPLLYTYSDVLDELDYFARYEGVGADQTLRRMCVQRAYRQIATAHDWSFLHDNYRATVYAPDEFTTVEFDLTGGTYERQLTATTSGEEFPTWAEDACVRLGDPEIVCDVEARKSATVVTLDSVMCPTADIDETTATLFPRWYRLPNDFVSMARPADEDSWCLGAETDKESIEHRMRYDDSTGNVERFAVGAPRDLYGAMALYLWPPTNEDETLDIPYRRRPRAMRYSGHEDAEVAGTIAVTANSATVAGTDTSFATAMIGSLLRIGDDSTYHPTGLEGKYPYVEQRSIIAIASTSSLTLDAAVASSASGVKYRITDPVDVDIAVYDAFIACAKMHLATALKMKGARFAVQDYRDALRRAKEADFRSYSPRRAGVPGRHIGRLNDGPINRTVATE